MLTPCFVLFYEMVGQAPPLEETEERLRKKKKKVVILIGSRNSRHRWSGERRKERGKHWTSLHWGFRDKGNVGQVKQFRTG